VFPLYFLQISNDGPSTVWKGLEHLQCWIRREPEIYKKIILKPVDPDPGLGRTRWREASRASTLLCWSSGSLHCDNEKDAPSPSPSNTIQYYEGLAITHRCRLLSTVLCDLPTERSIQVYHFQALRDVVVRPAPHRKGAACFSSAQEEGGSCVAHEHPTIDCAFGAFFLAMVCISMDCLSS
jgi:hypothetical protein